jgi:lipopolysaccharide biosynthesis glycosyltransferase
MAVAAVSLAENNSQSSIAMHALTCDLDRTAEEMLRASLREYKHVSLQVHYVDDPRLGEFFVDKFMTKECYLRILAPEIISCDIKRIIYLDCDLVVLDDLRPLWNVELDGKIVAAAPDYPRLPLLHAPDRLASIGIPKDATYVNSGVLVINLERWRNKSLTQQLFDYIRLQGSALVFYDQDAINAVLCDDIHVLDCRWNLQARMYRTGRKAAPVEFNATHEARRGPAIIHFTGSEKPWLFRSRIACKGKYLFYLKKTAWRDSQLETVSAMHSVEFWLDRLLSKAGIDYLQILYCARRAPAKLRELVAALLHRVLKADQSSPGAHSS